MTKSLTMLAIAATSFGLAACVPLDLPVSSGGSSYQVERPIYAPSSVSVDGDTIEVRVERSGGMYADRNQVALCLHNTRGWDKQFGIDGYPPIRVSAGQVQCTPVNAAAHNVRFWKAKTFGVLMDQGTRSFNLVNLETGSVHMYWGSD